MSAAHPAPAPAQPGTNAVVETNPEGGAYKVEFVKVYQDAGVVGVSMLTLLVLCLLLGLFCGRLIKMYIALTESRDKVETARTEAIEKLAANVLLLRTEMTAAVAEIRRENADTNVKLSALQAANAGGRP